MLFDIIIQYQDNVLKIQTSQFDSVESVKQQLLFDASKNVMLTDSHGQGHLIRKDFVNVVVMWNDENGQHETLLTKDDIVQELIEDEKEPLMAEEPIIPEVLSDDETLPEIPTKFKSFREFFQDQNRLRNTFLNSIAEKMAKGNELLQAIDSKLSQENDAVESLQKKFIGK